MRNDRYYSLNLNIRGIGQSPTLAINELSKQLQAKGKHVYPMGLGQSPFPVPSPVVEALKMHAHEKDYLAVNGLDILRKSVARFHRQIDGVDISSRNVLIGPGSKELMFLLQLVYYGDIILPTPCWVSYAPQAKIVGRNIRLIHTTFENKWLITPEQLESYLTGENDKYRPRLLVLNYPSNPHGGTYSSEELTRIARVAQKHEIIILSDEIYGQLHHKGRHISIARFYPERTIISSGLSKWCGAGGWRLGTFAFPSTLAWLMNSMAAVASETYTSVSTPIQYAAEQAFQGGIVIERYLCHARRILSYIGKRSTEILTNSGIRVHPPDGAFYLFIDFSQCSEKLIPKGIIDSNILCAKLLDETGVAILPGGSFQRPAEELTARLAYVNFDGSKALATSETIPLSERLPEDFGNYCCASVFEAIHKIVEWLN
ncbi:MAG: aminotransferase class I/II-fold pyridoxal phosphate-dependent enzyme [Planctomycetes bacterium]|nr:aminotransferase class I/II-fold pyridoxal phosphate-dependent enzyme [Planctomycetota bacterium]MBL7142981.1 aminotransferase class I/II-fold pyridoxal phosphate-dependent enzyme [Phycisphaerae bacterium]